MSSKRLPITLFLGGLALKGLLVLLWRLRKIPELFTLLTTYDPGAFWFAEKTTPFFFDQRRIAPTGGESALFELLLIIGFGIECLLLGFVVQWFLPKGQSLTPQGGGAASQ